MYNAKIKNIEDKIPDITNLPTTTTALTAVENKIPNVSTLVKKTDYITKLVKLKIKLLLIMIMINILLLKNLIPELISENFNAGLKQAYLESRNDMANFV